MASIVTSPPPPSTCFQLSFPRPFVLVVTVDREPAMNSVPMRGHWEGNAIWEWFDKEPDLRVAIITGKGSRSFSAGADLIEQRNKNVDNSARTQTMPASGFMGLSRRVGKKPVIAAVNGATFGLPEAKRGLYAAAGGLPRVARIFGMQLASEIVLADRVLTAKEVQHFGFARISKSPESLLDEALDLADKVGTMSPDAVIVSRAGLREAWETASVERVIGLQAFAKKQKPVWAPSKL